MNTSAKRNGKQSGLRERWLMASLAGAAFGGILIAVAHEGAGIADSTPHAADQTTAVTEQMPAAEGPAGTAVSPTAERADQPTATPTPIPRSRRSRAS